MSSVSTPGLVEGEMVPVFQLTTTSGQVIRLRDYRHRRNLVIVLLADPACGPCRALLQQMAAEYREYRSLNTEILAILEAPPDASRQMAAELKLPFPVLVDEARQVLARYLPGRRNGMPVLSVFITDRYGELYSQILAEDEQTVPGSDEVLDWLQFIEAQCPE